VEGAQSARGDCRGPHDRHYGRAMAKIVVAGGGACGLAAALMLEADAHEVTVLERDPAPHPGSQEVA